MKTFLALMVIAAAADFLSATVEIHHEAILPFLEAEDQALVKKLNDPQADPPSPFPTKGPRPTFNPSRIPKGLVSCFVQFCLLAFPELL